LYFGRKEVIARSILSQQGFLFVLSVLHPVVKIPGKVHGPHVFVVICNAVINLRFHFRNLSLFQESSHSEPANTLRPEFVKLRLRTTVQTFSILLYISFYPSLLIFAIILKILITKLIKTINPVTAALIFLIKTEGERAVAPTPNITNKTLTA
jgi:hypothetical protein